MHACIASDTTGSCVHVWGVLGHFAIADLCGPALKSSFWSCLGCVGSSQIFVDQLFILVPGAACLDSPCVLRLYALVRTCTHLYALVRTCMRLYALVYSPCVLRLYALVRACINSPCVLRLYALVRDCIYSPCVLRLYAQPL
jgi:hypothetical protein